MTDAASPPNGPFPGWRMMIRQHGGPEVIEKESLSFPPPASGELLVLHEAIGLNFIDTYVRSGLYPAQLPAGLGVEAAGKVIAIGEGVQGFAMGDRVAYSGSGCYATHGIVAANRAVKLPDGVDSETAAALLMKGMTSCALIEHCAHMKAGQTALVHSAAGGVGSIMVPWLLALGVTVIAHSGSPEKAAAVKAAGAQHSLTGSFDDLPQAVRAIAPEGVDVVFDGVGAASWAASIACLRRRGLMVSFGNASGPVPPITLLELSRGGSLFVTRPTIYDYVVEQADFEGITQRLLDMIAKGVVKPDIGQRFRLEDAARAHEALAARQTRGSTILLP